MARVSFFYPLIIHILSRALCNGPTSGWMVYVLAGCHRRHWIACGCPLNTHTTRHYLMPPLLAVTWLGAHCSLGPPSPSCPLHRLAKPHPLQSPQQPIPPNLSLGHPANMTPSHSTLQRSATSATKLKSGTMLLSGPQTSGLAMSWRRRSNCFAKMASLSLPSPRSARRHPPNRVGSHGGPSALSISKRVVHCLRCLSRSST